MTTVNQQTAKALLADSNYGPARKVETITGSAAHVAGTIMARLDTGRKLVPYASGQTDGSEDPICVLLEDADATSADLTAVVGFAGIYVTANMSNHDDTVADLLESKGIYFK